MSKDWFLFTVFTIIIGVFLIPGNKSSEQIVMIGKFHINIATKMPNFSMEMDKNR